MLQHGFRRARLCESQLLQSPSTIHDMLNYWNKKTQLDVIVLDFSKSFDTVPHDRLFKSKLDHYGINGHICGAGDRVELRSRPIAGKSIKCKYLIDMGAAVSVLLQSCANGTADTSSLITPCRSQQPDHYYLRDMQASS